MTRYRQDHSPYDTTVKLGIKELLNKEQTGFKEFFTDYQPFYTIKGTFTNLENVKTWH